jgi:hypothetical protein
MVMEFDLSTDLEEKTFCGGLKDRYAYALFYLQSCLEKKN